jgi:hypothetical protein
MDHLIGVLPVVGTDSLDGFAAGILVAGACFLALATPWRAHKRGAAARYETPAKPKPKPKPDTWTWRPIEPARRYATSTKPVPDQTAASSRGREISALTGGNRLPSDHRPLINAAQQRWGLPADLGSRAYAVPAPRGEARSLDDAANTSALGERLVSPGDMNSRPGSHRAAHPLGDPTFGSPASQQKPPGGRHAPRHAAPAPTLSGKMSSLFTTRSLADSSRG